VQEHNVIALGNMLYSTHPWLRPTYCTYFDFLVVQLNGLEHEVHTYGVAMALHKNPVLEPLHHARLADTGISDQNHLQARAIRHIHTDKTLA